jgi:hypothetical protein
VHAWLSDFNDRRKSDCWPSLAQSLGLPDNHPSLCERDAWKACVSNLSVEIAADTPPTGLIHWKVHRSSKCELVPEGDGMVLLDFTPEGACRSIENFAHWN